VKRKALRAAGALINLQPPHSSATQGSCTGYRSGNDRAWAQNCRAGATHRPEQLMNVVNVTAPRELHRLALALCPALPIWAWSSSAAGRPPARAPPRKKGTSGQRGDCRTPDRDLNPLVSPALESCWVRTANPLVSIRSGRLTAFSRPETAGRFVAICRSDTFVGQGGDVTPMATEAMSRSKSETNSGLAPNQASGGLA